VCTFRGATQIETTAPEVDWPNKGIFISLAGRRGRRRRLRDLPRGMGSCATTTLGQLVDAERLRWVLDAETSFRAATRISPD
jgi:hypothetical protein